MHIKLYTSKNNGFKTTLILAFDSKEYRRETLVAGIRKTIFYSPLGAGIKIDVTDDLLEEYNALCIEKRKLFAISDDCYLYSSGYLAKKYGPARTCAFLESILYGLTDFIEEAFFSYLILPPIKIPSISVGGVRCATTTVPTFDFMVQMNPMFSYITAWNYFQRPRDEVYEIHIDSFSSRTTLAWQELKNKNPLIFPHGDECNIGISLADAIAYVTDVRLDRTRKRLEPDNIDNVWKAFAFTTETRFLTYNNIAFYRWFDYTQISWEEYQARPILFIDAQSLNMRVISNLEPFKAAVEYVSKKGGSLQGFDLYMDSSRLQDGDIYVYAGEQSKERAETFRDMFDIEIFSVIELRQKIEEEKK